MKGKIRQMMMVRKGELFAKGRVNVTTRDEALCYACRRLV